MKNIVTDISGMGGREHAKAIFEKGREKYIEELRAAGRTDEDFFEWDDAEAFPEKVSA